MGSDRLKGRIEGVRALDPRHSVLPQGFKIGRDGCCCRRELVIRVARLELLRHRIDEVVILRRQCLQVGAAPPQHALMGAEGLIKREGKVIDGQAGHVDPPVRRVGHGIYCQPRPRPLHPLTDGLQGHHLAKDVRRPGDGNEARFRPQERIKILQPRHPGLGVQRPKAEDHAALRQHLPGANVRFMVKDREDHLVTGRELRGQGPSQELEASRGGRCKDHFLGLRCANQARQGGAMNPQGLGSGLGPGIGAAGLDIGMAEIGRHRVHGSLKNLRTASVIEIGPAVV